MIKSVVECKTISINEYPKLREAENGLIVLFNDKKAGMVVRSDEIWELGHFSESWAESEFKDLPVNTSVNLSNGVNDSE